VVNPFAQQLTFIDDRTRTRRDHKKYLGLIKAIALLHQYQREIKTVQHNGQQVEYIEVTLKDIEIANQLAHEVLGRTLDELPPQTRRLLNLIYDHTQEHCKTQAINQGDYRFSRREIREYTAWGNTQLSIHLKRLEALEYLIVHRGGRGQTFVYELAYQGKGDEGSAFVMNLLETELLKDITVKNPSVGGKKSGLNANLSGQKPNLSGSNRGHIAPISGGIRGSENSYSPDAGKDVEETEENTEKRTYREPKKTSELPLPDTALTDNLPLVAQSHTEQGVME
jgi:hypothetical protein